MGCDDYPVHDYDPEVAKRQRLNLAKWGSGAIQLAKCPTCYALVEESDLDQHLQRAHAGVRIPPN